MNISTIKNYYLALPQKREQEAVVERIEAETYPIETAIDRLEREVELLREYRTRLVADVVTGKLDVREAAARLPDEPSPDAAEDDAANAGEIDIEEEDAVA